MWLDTAEDIGDAVVCIRPSRGGSSVGGSRVGQAIAFLPMAVLGVVRGVAAHPATWIWWAAGLASLAAFAFLARADFFAQTSLCLTPNELVRTGYLGRTARCRRELIREVVQMRLVATRLGGIPAPWLLFLADDRSVLLRAYVDYYPANELARLEDGLSVPWRDDYDTKTFLAARRQVPGAFPWPLAHLWITTIGLMVGVVVLASIIAAFV